MENLLEETIKILKEYRKEISDIKWIGTYDHYVNIDDFLRVADIEYDFRNQQMTITIGGELVNYLFDLISKACLQFVDYKSDLKALFYIINNNEDIVMTTNQEKIFDKYYEEYLKRLEDSE